MDVEIAWHSEKGRRTDDNRDCGGVGLRPDAVLGIVLDGATTAPDSGALSRRIARDLVDWFVAADPVMTAEGVVGQLRLIHTRLAPDFRMDSASYVIALVVRGASPLVLHAGDSLAGRVVEGCPVEWLIRPHTLANAVEDIPVAAIAASPLRNRLTRSFRAKAFMTPDIIEVALNEREELVLATDGFWAGLAPADQARFMAGERAASKDGADDCSVLRVSMAIAEAKTQIAGADEDNMYVAAC